MPDAMKQIGPANGVLGKKITAKDASAAEDAKKLQSLLQVHEVSGRRAKPMTWYGCNRCFRSLPCWSAWRPTIRLVAGVQPRPQGGWSAPDSLNVEGDTPPPPS